MSPLKEIKSLDPEEVKINWLNRHIWPPKELDPQMITIMEIVSAGKVAALVFEGGWPPRNAYVKSTSVRAYFREHFPTVKLQTRTIKEGDKSTLFIRGFPKKS